MKNNFTTPTMPDKWAVIIENEADLKDLQDLFPSALHISGKRISSIQIRDNAFYLWFVDAPHYTTVCKVGIEGYTIYTLNKLKELLK